MENILKILQIIRNDLLIFFKGFKLPDIFKVKVVEMPERETKVNITIPEIKASEIKIPPIEAEKIIQQ